MQVGLLGRFLPWGGASSGPAPSPEPAVGLHVAAAAASQDLSLLVLTAGSLDKWQVRLALQVAAALDAQASYRSMTIMNRWSLVLQIVVSATLGATSQAAAERRPL